MPLDRLAAGLDEAGALEFLREEGVDDGDLSSAVSDELIMAGDVWQTPDDTFGAAAQLTDGLVLTHRLAAHELEDDAVSRMPDLVVLDWDAPDGLDLPGDGRLRFALGPRVPGEDLSTLAGPAGWLDGFAPGDLVAFRRSGGAVSVERVETPADDEVEVGLLRDAVEGRIPAGRGEEPFPLLLDALTHDPTAFRRPVRPLGELLETAGLSRRGFSFGRAAEEWLARHERYRASSVDRLAGKWGFDTCCREAFDTVVGTFDALEASTAPPVEDYRAAAKALAHGAVALAFAEHVLRGEAGGDDRLVRFADHIEDAARDRLAAPVHLLRGLEAERRGDVTSAEAALRAAVRADPDYGPAASELAYYEVDRSNVAAALRLLRHPDVEARNELRKHLEELQSRMDARWRGVGRNDRCPCGSGRKFKVCCLRTGPTVPLSDRVGLLSRKLAAFAHRDHRRARVVGVASSACDPDAEDFVARLNALSESPVITDFVVFEGGGAEDYLDERGGLLPPDERELLEALIEEPRRAWEVTAAEPGRVTLESVEGSEPPVVSAAAGTPEVGDLMLARHLALADGADRFVGVPLVVPPVLRDEAIRLAELHADADGWAELFGRMLDEVADDEVAEDGHWAEDDWAEDDWA